MIELEDLRIPAAIRPVDPSQQPHLRADQLAERIGAKQTTMANKGA